MEYIHLIVVGVIFFFLGFSMRKKIYPENNKGRKFKKKLFAIATSMNAQELSSKIMSIPGVRAVAHTEDADTLLDWAAGDKAYKPLPKEAEKTWTCIAGPGSSPPK